ATAAGARNTADSHGNISFGHAQSAIYHLQHHRFADCAFARQCLTIHTEQTLLGAVGVADKTIFKPGRAAGNRGNRRRHAAAGAGFGGGQMPAALSEYLPNPGTELVSGVGHERAPSFKPSTEGASRRGKGEWLTSGKW